jgi:hypothetical protein
MSNHSASALDSLRGVGYWKLVGLPFDEHDDRNFQTRCDTPLTGLEAFVQKRDWREEQVNFKKMLATAVLVVETSLTAPAAH